MFDHCKGFDHCKWKPHCQDQDCSFKCYPFTFLHGVNGDSGLWKTRNIPKKYDNCFANNLPVLEPDSTDTTVRRYLSKTVELVRSNIGLFLYSIPSKQNRLGTGTGKTTTACAIINEYVLGRSREDLSGLNQMTDRPALFVSMSDFQNVYNGQFRGDRLAQEQASNKFYQYKWLMKRVELLVLDDIALRGSTEAFSNELYEIINQRVNADLTTVYTSNEPLTALTEIFGHRIVSRIEGSTDQIPFSGKDHRKKVW